MATATIVKAWKDSDRAYLAIRVAETGGNVEYIGSIPLVDLDGLTIDEQQTLLVEAAKAVRDAQISASATLDVPGGTVTI